MQIPLARATSPILVQALFLLTLAIGFLTTALGAEELKPIFDGGTLAGWKVRGGAVFEVQDGVIAGKSAETFFFDPKIKPTVAGNRLVFQAHS